MTARRFGWLCGAGAAALVFGVSPAGTLVWALATEGAGQWPLLLAAVPQWLLAHWFVGGAPARARQAERPTRSTRQVGDAASRRQLQRAIASRSSSLTVDG